VPSYRCNQSHRTVKSVLFLLTAAVVIDQLSTVVRASSKFSFTFSFVCFSVLTGGHFVSMLFALVVLALVEAERRASPR